MYVGGLVILVQDKVYPTSPPHRDMCVLQRDPVFRPYLSIHGPFRVHVVEPCARVVLTLESGVGYTLSELVDGVAIVGNAFT